MEDLAKSLPGIVVDPFELQTEVYEVGKRHGVEEWFRSPEALEIIPNTSRSETHSMTLDVEKHDPGNNVFDAGLAAPTDVHMPSCFTIQIDRGQQEIGISVDPDDGQNLVVTAVEDEGLVQDWNAKHPSNQITIGDYIVSVNGIHGDPNQLIDTMNAHMSLQLEIRPHVERTVSLIRDPPAKKLGLVLRQRESGDTLLIREIGAGIVADWNRDHAGKELKCGDRILEVNSRRGRGKLLNDLVKTVGPTIDLRISPLL